MMSKLGKTHQNVLVFAVKYLWWSWRVGYRDNPYEVEARAAEK